MPAPRECRSCGRKLDPDIRRCAGCGAHVVEFAARAVSEPSYVGLPRHNAVYSRWRGSPTTLGPIGRLSVTVGLGTLLAFAFAFGGAGSPFTWIMVFFWAVIATMVLRGTWRKVEIPDGRRGGLVALVEHRIPALAHDVDVRPFLWIGAGIGVALIVFLAHRSAHHGVVVIALSLFAISGMCVAWFVDR